MGGAICLALTVAGILIAVVLAWRMLRAPVPRDLGIQPRSVEDGFWLDAPGLDSGSVVHYRCRVGGQTRTGSFTVEPGPRGQFIYTGARPSDIEILEVVSPPGIPIQREDRWTEFTPPPTPPPPPPGPRRRPSPGHPPAY
jgi:hypothetical protein